MKGLLVKDVCILKMQKNVLLILLAMCVVFTVFLESPTYIVSLMPMYGCIVVLGTLSYDEFDRGYSFLFTLPVSKRGYVKEKYVLGLLFCGGIWLLSVLGSLVYVCINGEIPIDVSLFLSYAMPFVLVLILLGVALPVQLKCGNEKGRLAVVAVGLGAFLQLEAVWLIADIVNGLMALPNLIAIVALSGVVVAETKAYFEHLQERKQQSVESIQAMED